MITTTMAPSKHCMFQPQHD